MGRAAPAFSSPTLFCGLPSCPCYQRRSLMQKKKKRWLVAFREVVVAVVARWSATESTKEKAKKEDTCERGVRNIESEFIVMKEKERERSECRSLWGRAAVPLSLIPSQQFPFFSLLLVRVPVCVCVCVLFASFMLLFASLSLPCFSLVYNLQYLRAVVVVALHTCLILRCVVSFGGALALGESVRGR
jgi:hypothetical protein